MSSHKKQNERDFTHTIERKRILAPLIALLMIGTAFAGIAFTAPTAEASGTTYTVDDDGGADYASIQAAINAAHPGDTITVAAGMYTEQIIIDKDLTLQGATGATIVAPDTRNTYTIAENDDTWDPIVFAYGGTMSGNDVSGSGTISVTIDGFEIDGGNKATADPRYVGVFGRNIDGTISNNEIHDMFDPDGAGDGPETFGIEVYGDSDITIEYNTVEEFSRGGIEVKGDDNPDAPTSGSAPNPVADINNNTVYGNGVEMTDDWWAENGIQVASGTAGTIADNHVSECGLKDNPDWDSTAIVVKDCDGIVVEGNTVSDNDYGIGVTGWWYTTPKDPAEDTIIRDNTANTNKEGIHLGSPVYNTLIEGNTLTNNNYGVAACDYGDLNGVTGTEVHYNTIEGNSVYGVESWASSGTPSTVDATYNWWGDTSGPSGQGTGSGDAVSTYVDYDPWLGMEAGKVLNEDTSTYYDTIQAAINAASSDDTITVGAGTYHEALTVDKALTLQSDAGAEHTILNASGADRAIDIDGTNLGTVTIEGFTVENWDNVGICNGYGSADGNTIHVLNNIVYAPEESGAHGNSVQVAGDDSTVIGNDVEGSYLASEDWAASGILVVAGDNVVIKNNNVHDYEAGIVAMGYESQYGGPAVGTQVLNNMITDGGQGVSVQGDARDTLFQGNDISNCEYGITAKDHSYAPTIPTGTEAHYNNFINCSKYGAYAIDNTALDVTHNWWGASSGPYNATDNPTGEGDFIWGDITFDPWLRAPIDAYKTATVADGGTLDATSEADVTVDITGDSVDVTVLNYTADPNGGGGLSTGAYSFDVYIPDAASLSEVTIKRWVDSEPTHKKLYYLDDSTGLWTEFGTTGYTSDSGRTDYVGYVYGTTTGTTPGMSYFSGGPLYGAEADSLSLDPLSKEYYKEDDTVSISGQFLPEDTYQYIWDATDTNGDPIWTAPYEQDTDTDGTFGHNTYDEFTLGAGAEGECTVTVKQSGTSLTATQTFKYDQTNPESTVTSPADGSYQNVVDTISGGCSDGYGEVQTVEITIHDDTDNDYWTGSVWGSETWLTTDSNPSSWSYDSSGVTWESGHTYTVTSRATDKAGLVQTTTTTSTFTFDDTDPSVTVTSPNGGEYWSDTHDITWTASDTNMASNPITLYYSDDSGSTWTEIASGEANDGSYSWDTTGLSDGATYQVKVEAVDEAGNTGADTSDGDFTIDNTNPSSTVTSPADGDKWNKITTIEGTASDATSPISNVHIRISDGSGNYWDGSDWTTTTDTWLDASYDSGTGNWDYTTIDTTTSNWKTCDANAEITIESRATDSAGNQETPSAGNTWTYGITTDITNTDGAWHGFKIDWTEKTGMSYDVYWHTGTFSEWTTATHKADITTGTTTYQCEDMDGQAGNDINVAVRTVDTNDNPSPFVGTSNPQAHVWDYKIEFVGVSGEDYSESCTGWQADYKCRKLGGLSDGVVIQELLGPGDTEGDIPNKPAWIAKSTMPSLSFLGTSLVDTEISGSYTSGDWYKGWTMIWSCLPSDPGVWEPYSEWNELTMQIV